MKHCRLGLWALILLLVGMTADAAETTLRITLQLPLKSHIGQNLLLFKTAVEKASQGEIAIEIYDAAQLYKDNEVPQAVSSGEIEMGVASLTRFVDEIPAVDIFDLPFTFNTEALVRAATAQDSPIRRSIDTAILATGSRVLWWQAYGSAILLSKDGPLKTPAAIQGKKVRVFGKTLGRFVEAAGGIPELISGSEQYQAYQNGVVDIGMTGVSSIGSRSLWQVMDWITVTNHADIEFVVLINENYWQALPGSHKEIITQAAVKADAAVRDAIYQIEAQAYAFAAEQGMSTYKLTPEEVKAWKAVAQPVVEEYLASAGELGRQLYDAALKLQEETR
ncbi:MAG: TRAP transporter substrate-binding protein DctP [Candidatus Competibacteraceae bacterium]|jgi:C4-dicarboxylate-binding protein DctP|nr:TRAP transporter substrate-binding protein DctP [Candidatus Competibacteraceae bacterium]